MTAANFPDNPQVNDEFSIGSRTWRYDGVAWKIITAALGPTGPTGPSGTNGTVGVDGATGPTGPAGLDSTVPGPAGPTGPAGGYLYSITSSTLGPSGGNDGDIWFRYV